MITYSGDILPQVDRTLLPETVPSIDPYVQLGSPFSSEPQVTDIPDIKSFIPKREVNRNAFTKAFLSSVDNLQGTAYGTVGLVGDAIGWDWLKELGYEGYLANEDEAAENAPTVGSVYNINSVADAGTWIAETAGALTPSILEFAALALAGGGVGALLGKFGGKKMLQASMREAVKREIAAGTPAEEAVKRILADTVKKFAEYGAKAAVVGGSTVHESGSNWGSDVQSLGIENTNPYRNLFFGAVSGASELIGGEGKILSSILGRNISQNAAERLMPVFRRELAKGVGKGIFQEGSQEALQEFLSSANSAIGAERPLNTDDVRNMVDAFAAGAVGGVAFGAGSGSINYFRGKSAFDEAEAAKNAEALRIKALVGDDITDEMRGVMLQEEARAADFVAEELKRSANAPYVRSLDVLNTERQNLLGAINTLKATANQPQSKQLLENAKSRLIDISGQVAQLELEQAEAIEEANKTAAKIKAETEKKFHNFAVNSIQSWVSPEIENTYSPKKITFKGEQTTAKSPSAVTTAGEPLDLSGRDGAVKREVEIADRGKRLSVLANIENITNDILTKARARHAEMAGARALLTETFGENTNEMLKEANDKFVQYGNTMSELMRQADAASRAAGSATEAEWWRVDDNITRLKSYAAKLGVKDYEGGGTRDFVPAAIDSKQDIREVLNLYEDEASTRIDRRDARLQNRRIAADANLAGVLATSRDRRIQANATRDAEYSSMLKDTLGDVEKQSQVVRERTPAFESELRGNFVIDDFLSLLKSTASPLSPKRFRARLSRIVKDAYNKVNETAETKYDYVEEAIKTLQRLSKEAESSVIRGLYHKTAEMMRANIETIVETGMFLEGLPQRINSQTSIGNIKAIEEVSRVPKPIPLPAKPARKKTHTDEVSNWAAEVTQLLPYRPRTVRTVKSTSSERIPRALRDKLQPNWESAFDPSTNQIYLFADNIKTKRQAIKAILHELVGHYGLRSIMSEKELMRFLKLVHRDLSKTKQFDKLTKGYEKLSAIKRAEEYVARLAEKLDVGEVLSQDENAVWNKFKAFIKSVLGKLNLIKITNKDINDVLKAAIINLAHGKDTDTHVFVDKDLHGLRASLLTSVKDRANRVAARKAAQFVNDAENGPKAVEMGTLDIIIQNVADAFRRTLQIQNAVESSWSVVDNESGKAVFVSADKNEATTHLQTLDSDQYSLVKGEVKESSKVYEAEMMSHNILQHMLRTFRDRYIAGPDGLQMSIANLFKAMDVKAEEAYQALASYAYAKHALERNEAMRVRHARGETLSLSKRISALKKEIRSLEKEEATTENKRRLKELKLRLENHEAKFKTTWQEAMAKPEVASLSGMSDEEASSIIEKYGNIPEMNIAYGKLRDVHDFRIKVAEKYKLVPPAVIEMWKTTYDNYVPLKDWEDETRAPLARQHKGGRGISVSEKSFVEYARGRTSRAQDPILWSIKQAQDMLRTASKVETGRAFWSLVKDNKHLTNLWEVDETSRRRSEIETDYETGKITEEEYALARRALALASGFKTVRMKNIDGDPALKRTRKNAKFEGDATSVVSIIDEDGYRVEVKVNDDALAMALKGLNIEAPNGILKEVFRFIGAITRMMAKFNTTLNPDFLLANPVRDSLTAALNMADIKRHADIPKSAFDGLRRKIFAELRESRRVIQANILGKPIDSEMNAWFELYKEYGSFTDMYDLKEIEDLSKDMAKAVKNMGEEGVMAWGKSRASEFYTWIEAASSSMENMARLAAFKHIATLYIEHGVPKELAYKKAAQASLNITVNFTKKGAWSPYLSPLFMFYNASIQSNARLLKAIFSNPKWALTYMPMLVVAPMAVAAINRAIGGDDDDGISYYDKIPTYVKQTNAIFFVPGIDNFYVKVPLPYGYNVFNVLGHALEEMWSKDKSAVEGAVEVVKSMFNNFMPFGDSDEGLVAAFSPTIVRPFVQIYGNTNYFGKQIYPEVYGFTHGDVPNSQKYWKNSSIIWKAVAEGLNTLSGGSKTKPGMVDVSPEWISHLVSFYLGGMGSTLARSYKSIEKIAAGEEMSLNDFPIIRRFSGNTTDADTSSAYYELASKIKTADLIFKKYYSAGMSSEDYRDLVEDAGPARRLYKMLSANTRTISKLRKAEHAILFDNTLSYGTKATRVAKIRQRIAEVQKRFILRARTYGVK